MITIKGTANSGTSWYMLHKAVEYCKKRCSPSHYTTEQPTVWYYGEFMRQDIIARIEKLYPEENIIGTFGCLNLVDSPTNIPYDITDIIANSMTWKAGDIVIIDAPVYINIPDCSADRNRDVINYALTALQNHVDVVMYAKEQLNRRDKIEFTAVHTHKNFKWSIKSNGDTKYINLLSM